ncbi:MAG: DUF1559 domain-containing protein [Planctomycetaceae bacterium]
MSLKSITVSGKLPPENATLRLTAKTSDAAAGLTELVNGWTKEQLGEDAASLQLESDGDSAVLNVTSVEQAIAVIGSVQRLMTGQSRPATMTSLKQFGLALHKFRDVLGHFPPQSLVDENGKRLLSCRVLILPYLDAYPLYQEFRLGEPWDSEHNRRLIEKMPNVFRSPASAGHEPDVGMTLFVAPLTASTIFGQPGPGVKITDITDGTSNTILLVEAAADRAVIWTKPDDLMIDLKNPLSSIIDENADGFAALFADGSARVWPNDIAVEMLQAILSMNGGELVDWNK